MPTRKVLDAADSDSEYSERIALNLISNYAHSLSSIDRLLRIHEKIIGAQTIGVTRTYYQWPNWQQSQH
ncbi:uncharacterized protein BO97DRAFT_421596 [Aspergillus homomorphus CBS 101889]|uniref:Uncharacterized protein n=1 Tax=Aspergillus homomorphus (strain CBS 101889) TaxID=1450537 RepID=A0A395I6L4_ASPHC|nr:hypothetical protein BO97DRAFT_421596 [Aspergillus homomorphus CBS 101889]RAL15476.1 hypothetical protein BO97DRAFT_421596 [Aspergillus homomorphus CBS 101889]